MINSFPLGNPQKGTWQILSADLDQTPQNMASESDQVYTGCIKCRSFYKS